MNAPCHRPLIRMIIQHDGEVCNCYEDTHGAFKPGNVYQHSLEDLWFSEGHIQVVEDLIERRRGKYNICRKCLLSPTGQAPEASRSLPDATFREPQFRSADLPSALDKGYVRVNSVST
jgi:radical SAM protein with 4Fe4S-binding SPASM domain